jgi:hypothetical protein
VALINKSEGASMARKGSESDKSYTLTGNTEQQINKLAVHMSDGKKMTSGEIAEFLGRKWINGVMHYLAQRHDLELIKDGRKIVAYRISKVGELKSSTASIAEVKTATPKVSKPRKKKAATTSKEAAQTVAETVPSEETQPQPIAAQVAPEAAMRVISQTEDAKVKVQEAIETINRRAAEKKEPEVVDTKSPDMVNSFDDVGPIPAFLKRK